MVIKKKQSLSNKITLEKLDTTKITTVIIYFFPV